MISKLEGFLILENIQQAKKILSKQGLNSEEEVDFKNIRDRLKKQPNLIGFFVKLRYESNQDIESILRVIDWIKNNKNLTGQLPKNILEYKSIEEIEDDINKLKGNQLVKKFYKSLYSSMRRMVDTLNDKSKKSFHDIAYAFMSLSEEVRKKFTPLKYFEKNNVSLEDLLKALKNYTETQSVNNDKESIMQKLEKYKGKYKIPYDQDGILVIRSNDKDLVCEIGSQRWCIVYQSDSYAEHYFGDTTFNTQYIIYNFNLPSSASNSLFGVTIDINGNALGGASQDRSNNTVALPEILKLTNIPDGIIIPDPLYINVNHKLGMITTLFFKEGVTYVDIAKKVREEFQGEYERYLKMVYNNIDVTYKYNYTNERIKIFNNTFKDKTYDEIKNIMSDGILKNLLVCVSAKEYIGLAANVENRLNMHYLLLYMCILYINSDGANVRGISRVLTKSNDILEVSDMPGFIKRLTIEQGEFNNIMDSFDGAEIKYSEEYIDTINDIRLIVVSSVLVNADEIDSWGEYFNLYNEHQLPNDERDYDAIFDEYENVWNLVENYNDDKEFYNFISNQVRIRKDDINPNELIEGIVLGVKEEAYMALSISGVMDLMVDLINDLELDITDYIHRDTTVAIFFGDRIPKYKEIMKKDIGIKVDEETGKDYVTVEDFSDFDGLIFQDDYFSNIDDYTRDEWYSLDDSEISNLFDDLDDYNILDIVDTILDTDGEEYFEKTILGEYENSGSRTELKYKVNSTDKLKEIRNTIQELLFESEHEDMFDYIKDEKISRSSNYAREGQSYSEAWDGLMNHVTDYLGCTPWGNEEDGLSSIYKQVDIGTSGNTKYETRFSIDLDTIISPLTDANYPDQIAYELGDSYEWDDIVTYVAKTLNTEIDASSVFDDANNTWVNDNTFNDAFRDN